MGIENLYIFAFGQMVVFASALWLKNKRNFPHFYLLIFFILILFYFGYFFLDSIGVLNGVQYREIISHILNLAPGPFLFLYSASLWDEEEHFRFKNYLFYYFPLLASILLGIPLLIMGNLVDFPSQTTNRLFQTYHYLFFEMNGIQSLFFSYVIGKRLVKELGFTKVRINILFQHRLEELRFRWIRFFVLLFLIHGTFNLLVANFNFFDLQPHPNFIQVANLVFCLFVGYVFSFYFIINPFILHVNPNQTDYRSLNKYEKSGLVRNEAREKMKRINKYMEREKPYLDSQLSLADLAEKLEMPLHEVSEILNGLMNQNFFDYVNNYRVEEFKRLLQDPAHQNQKLLILAFDSGFNSKSTFYGAFKRIVGMTPSEYRKSLK